VLVVASPEARARREGVTVTTASTSGWALVGGVDSELWNGAIPAAAGLHAGPKLVLSRRWAVVLAGGPDWGLASAEGIRAWSLRTSVQVEVALAPSLHLGLGTTGRMLWASGTNASTRQGATWGAIASVQYVLPMGPLHFAVGPRVDALARAISVQLAGAEVFRVPNLVAGLTMDVGGRRR
jgi:hypothetical protein